MDSLPRSGLETLPPQPGEDSLSPETLARVQDIHQGPLREQVLFFLLSLTSANTRAAYARDLSDFLGCLRGLGLDILDARDITEKMVLLWQKSLESRHTRYEGARRRIVNSSVARRLSGLSSFLRFCQERNVIPSNCAEFVTRPKLRARSATNAFTLDEVQRLLLWAKDQCETARQEHKPKAYASARLRFAVLYTLFSVGMRVEELCDLRIGDLESDSRASRLRMTVKGGEDHAPIIHPRTAEILREFVAEFRTGAGPDDPLFVRAQKVRHPTRLHRSSVFDMVRAAAEAAGIDKRVSPHSCRATLATLLHASGVPIGQIQDLLNHKSITTTSLYLKKTDELQDAAALKIDLAGIPSGRV